MSSDYNKFNNNINIKEIFLALLNKWYIFVAVVLVSAIASLLYSIFWVTPLYDSSGKLYIVNKNSTTINTAELSVSTYLTKDYENLIIDKAVLNEVAKDLKNEYSYGQLKSFISIHNPEDTRFIEITVRTDNPAASKRIVDSVCEVSQEKIVEMLGIDRVTIVRKGAVPTAPSVPNTMKNLTTCVLIGVILYVAIFCIIYFSNDKLNSAEDVEKYLEISVLGNIPFNNTKKK